MGHHHHHLHLYLFYFFFMRSNNSICTLCFPLRQDTHTQRSVYVYVKNYVLFKANSVFSYVYDKVLCH